MSHSGEKPTSATTVMTTDGHPHVEEWDLYHLRQNQLQMHQRPQYEI